MPIKDIKIFIDWCIQGDTTLQERYDMFMERKEIVKTNGLPSKNSQHH